MTIANILPIAVTAAAGKVGAAVVADLRARGVPVRALVHRADRRGSALEELGADVRATDLFDPVSVRLALRGTSSVVFIAPWHPQMLQAATAVAEAVRRERVTTLVSLTQWLAAPDHPSLATRQAWLAERLFDGLPEVLRVTVEPGFFADNYLAMTPVAAQLGVLPTPMGRGRNAPPSTEDIARTLAGAVLDPERHAGRRYRPTGPQMLSADEIAGVIGEAVGRRVRHVDVPIWVYLRALRIQGPRLGISPFLISSVRHYLAEHALGTWEAGGVTTHVRDVTGAPPEALLTVAGRYAARPEARRTARNLARELRDVTRVGLVPTPRTARLEALQQHPAPAAPALAGASELWRAEHPAPLPAAVA